MGREAVGVEIEQEYLGWGLEASERVQEEIGRSFHVLWADASTIDNLLRPSSVDAVVTSPPYVLVSLHAGDPERRLERVLRVGGTRGTSSEAWPETRSASAPTGTTTIPLTAG